jgi:predicted transcriptional regulator of viral defense system
MIQQFQNLGPYISAQRTKLADAVATRLHEEERPVVTLYSAFQTLRAVLAESTEKLYLRSDTSLSEHVRRVVQNLLLTRALQADRDYHNGVYRVLSLGECPAEDVCALVNPFGYIAHLSAMQRWGLTDRRPDALHLVMPAPSIVRSLVEARMIADYGRRFEDMPEGQAVKLTFIKHPPIVRARKTAIHHTKRLGDWLQIQGEAARLATVGQTFLDMLEAPQHCGGMAHVVDVWLEHAPQYRDEIITVVERHGTPIGKVRAGYLLDRIFEPGADSRIENWVQFAQRGSSRVLDPAKEFSAVFSEKWMLSINV